MKTKVQTKPKKKRTKPKHSSFKTIVRLLKLAYKINRRYFFIVVLTSALIGLAPVVSTYIFAEIINVVVDGSAAGDIGILAPYVIWYGLTMVVDMVAHQYYDSVVWKLYRYDMTEYIAVAVAKKTPTLDMSFFESPKFADLRAGALDAYEWRPADLLTKSFRMLQYFLGAALSLVAVFATFPRPSIYIFLAIIPAVVADYKFQAGLWDVWNADTITRRKYGRLLNYTTEEHVRDVKQLGIRNYFADQLQRLMHGVYGREKKVEHKRAIFVGLTSLIPLAVISYFLFVVAKDVIAGTVAVGTLSFFVTNMFNLKDKAGGTLFYVGELGALSKYVALVFEFLDLEPELRAKPGALKVVEAPAAIEMKNVSFKYPETDDLVLKDFSLSIAAGSKIAIVGENGAGKTTLVKLLLRFYDVTSGELLINGNNIKEYAPEVLRNNVAVLLQDFSVFRLPTLGENIGLGNIEQYQKDLKHACKRDNPKIDCIPPTIVRSAKQARADEIIMQTKKGYNTVFSRELGGVDFSGGETQRLALARTFYRDAGLVILDEPTSNVDAKAEAEIFDSLRDYLANKTVVFISHRFSTVRNADRIIVVDEGKIVEDGTHEELMKLAKGLYRKMFNLQAKGYN